jgi:hypothetical protein
MGKRKAEPAEGDALRKVAVKMRPSVWKRLRVLSIEHSLPASDLISAALDAFVARTGGKA